MKSIVLFLMGILLLLVAIHKIDSLEAAREADAVRIQELINERELMRGELTKHLLEEHRVEISADEILAYLSQPISPLALSYAAMTSEEWEAFDPKTDWIMGMGE